MRRSVVPTMKESTATPITAITAIDGEQRGDGGTFGFVSPSDLKLTDQIDGDFLSREEA